MKEAKFKNRVVNLGKYEKERQTIDGNRIVACSKQTVIIVHK